MATDIPETPTMEKKAKKDKSSKKRRREEEQNEAPKAAEPSTKKSKKHSKADAAAVESSDEDTPAKKPKKSKSKSADAVKAEAPLDGLLEKNSPFVQQTTSFYLSLSPCAHDFALEGLCAEHISPLLLTYYPPLKGVVLSYSNPRLSEQPEDRPAAAKKDSSVVLSKSIDEYAVTYVWLTADFTLFRPRKGTVLEGHVNLQNESILGLVCYNYFNAGIERSQLPSDWQWVSGEDDANNNETEEGEDHYVDGSGKKIEGKLIFKVTDFEATAGAETGGGTINISGSLRSLGNQVGASSSSKS